jgi:hypothetical protein
MKKFSVLIVTAFSLFLFSCRKTTGEGPVVNETRSVAAFAGIDQRVSASVYYTPSPDVRVEVSAQQNILDVLQTYVSNNKLVIKFRDGVRVHSHEAIRVEVSAPAVNSLRISGSGNLYVNGPFTPGTLEMDISGSGDMVLAELTTGYLDANISGSGNIRVSQGTATEERLKISGSGNLALENVTAARVTTNTSGSGTTRVTATQSLNVTISGSGSVFYRGAPQINLSVSGSGKVHPL